MSTSDLIKTFNSILESFLQQISPLVGTSYHHYYKQLIKVNAILPVQYFIQYALPMQDKILARDETYFTNPENHKEKIPENGLAEILRLQGIWVQLLVTSIDYIQQKTATR